MLRCMVDFQSPRFAGDTVLEEILNDPNTGTVKLGPGSPADSVQRLQQALFDLGWTLRIDPPFPDQDQFVIGIYGPNTTKTVLAFKTHHDIHFPPSAATGLIDGFAGPGTFARLDSDCVPFDASVQAIEEKAVELRAIGIDFELDDVPPATLPILTTRTAARHAFFDGEPGAIYHSAATGAHEVHGGLFTEYIAQGGGAGSLGSPISDVHAEDGRLRSDFEHGSLVLDPDTGAVELIEG
jgi:LGFP repeat